MSGRKHPSVRLSQQMFPSASTSSSSATTSAKKAKRQVAVSTFEKWQRNYDCDHQTLSWLRCDTDKADRNLVALLWCSVSRNYLLNEELLERLGDGNGEPADEQRARSCCLRSAQGGDVTPPHCASEGKQRASYKLRSDCSRTKKSGVRPCTTILGSGLTCCQVTWKNYICLWIFISSRI